MLRKVSYLGKLDNYTFDNIFYSLKKESYPEDATIFESGLFADRIYFVLNGSVSLLTSLYDSSLQRKLRRMCSFNTLKTTTTIRGARKRRTILRDLNPSKRCDLELLRLENGSIMSAILTVLHAKQNTQCIALRPTQLLVLKRHVVEKASQECIKLRLAIMGIKKKYTHKNTVFGSAVLIPPVIDAYKKYYDMLEEEKAASKAILRLKNGVLMVIARNRKKITAKIMSSRALITRLKAIKFAYERGWYDIARAVESNLVPPKAVYFGDFLNVEEMRKPICNQMVVLTKQSLTQFADIAPKPTEALQGVKKVEFLRKQVKILVTEMCELATLVEHFV